MRNIDWLCHFFNKGVEQLGGSKASMYLNLTPIVAALLAIIAYGSSMTFIQITGMMMVLVGVYVATAKTSRNNLLERLIKSAICFFE